MLLCAKLGYMTEDLKYPLGLPTKPEGPLSVSDRSALIDSIADFPRALRTAVKGLTNEQLDTPYRPDGWTVRQVVHHLADSHLNSYIRTRLALTEDTPTIRPYDEVEWAKLPDAAGADPELSLTLLDALHTRWTVLFRALPPEAFSKEFVHPASGKQNLDVLLCIYEWHGRHHLAHITRLASRLGW